MGTDIFGVEDIMQIQQGKCKVNTRLYKESIKRRLYGRLNKNERIYRPVYG